MSKKTGSYLTSAFLGGLFMGIQITTDVDASPSGLGLRLLAAVAHLATEKTVWMFQFLELVLLVAPWLGFLAAFTKHGLRGLIYYTVIYVGTMILVISAIS